MGMIRVLVAEDHTLVREETRDLLDRQPDIEVVGEAGDGASAVEQAMRLHPDVALFDIRLPRVNGIEATRQVRDGAPATAVLILSAYDDDDYVVQALDAGARGYLLKTVRSAELVDAVRRVYRGETVLHPDISQRISHLWLHRLDAAASVQLDEHEQDLIRLVARGLHNKEIARELGVSVRTVEGRVRMLLRRLGVKSRTEAVTSAAARGWLRDWLDKDER
jgi:DNA-binding NarL/FixJ family response regulator